MARPFIQAADGNLTPEEFGEMGVGAAWRGAGFATIFNAYMRHW